ncbi:MAG: peptidase S10 [Candidatus Eremiobacteraeota bacterium]|nr:peptidase S10 [Candidatus Eremiobacteraeota bacterium]
MIRRSFATLAGAVFLSPVIARADDPAAIPVPSTPAGVTHHAVTVAGTALHYTAIAGRTTIVDKAQKPAASVFSVAYLRDGIPHATRPVTFLWNGGPGSSTLWLHMGSFGPLRVETNGTDAIVPPGRLVPNDGTLLATTDLVFVDAPGTGYSRLVGTAKKDDFYGVDQDARAFAQFIEAWLSAHDRWGSPKFLIGESYGTTRAANVVDRLQDDGVGVNGIVLVSSALDLTGLDPALPGDDRSNVAFLPTEAAVAWYHHALPNRPDRLEPFLADVRAFASGAYATALLRGDALDAATRAAIVARLHAYTGLDPAYIDRANLRIDPTRFEKELERSQGRLVGRLDGRFNGYDVDRNADSPSYDPTLDASIQDAFVSEFNRYVRDDLNFRTDERYLPTNYADVGNAWKLVRDAGDVGLGNVGFPNVLPDLARALSHNPALRVLSANGYFDLATPFYGTEIGLGHLGLDRTLASHVTFAYYPSGHMIYLESASRAKLRGNIERFIRDSMRPAG